MCLTQRWKTILATFTYIIARLEQGFDMDRSTPATQIDGGNGN